jgi:hypothetical protein
MWRLEGRLLFFYHAFITFSHESDRVFRLGKLSAMYGLDSFQERSGTPVGTSFVREWTVEQAQAFADETVRNSGHCCTSACGGWK